MNARMAALRLTALTDLLLAAECLFLAGLLFGRPVRPFSAAWFWASALLLLGLSALLGGIDHGFLEAGGPDGAALPAHPVVRRLTGLTIGLIAGATLLYLGRQFFPAQPPVLFAALAGAQFLLFAACYLPRARFLLAGLDYAPVLLLALLLNVLHLGRGSGSPAMAAGLALGLAASVLQAAGVDRFRPLDRNGLYHLALMPAAVLLYLGGSRLP